MDQRPGRHGGPHVVAAVGAVGGLGGRWVEQRPGLLPGLDQPGIVGAVQLGAEHDLEVGPVGDGEADIGHADLQEAPGGLVGLAEGGGQAPEPVGGDRGQQPGLVAEVVGRGSVGDPGAAGQLAQADRGRSDLGDRLDGGIQQDPWQVAVVVGTSVLAGRRSCGHIQSLPGIFPLTRSTQGSILTMTRYISGPGGYAVNRSTVRSRPATPVPGRLTRGEWMLLAVAALAFVHHVDHVLRADNSGWPFTPDVTAFTISLLVYPILLLDFLLLRRRPWVRVGLVAVLFVALQAAHAVYEPPADQYGTWANGVSAVPHALGQPNLLDIASPALGVLSVVVSTLLSVAVLVALVLLIGEARAPHRASAPRPEAAVTAQPISAQGWVLRIGSAAGIAGALFGMVGNLAHPTTPAASQDAEGLARTIAHSGS